MIERIKEVEEYLVSNNINFKKDYVIKYDTYFKTGGKIKIFILPLEYEDLKKIVIFLNNKYIEFKIIGFTSNIILLDEIEYSIIISTKNLTKLTIENNTIQVDAGYSVQDFVRVAVINKAVGFEGLEGIPASIGGAIFMNAGAYGYNISDNLICVDCIDNNKVITLSKNDCRFNHRDSFFKQNSKCIILRAKFNFEKGIRNEIQEKIEVFHLARHSYQDFTYPNLGSMISIKGDIYHTILHKSIKYNIIYWVLKYIYKNPISKFINRKRANNTIFNKLLLKYLKNEKKTELKYILSTKSANILINDGTVSSREIIEYIYLMHDLIDKKYHIENEIVLESIYSVSDSIKDFILFVNEQKEEKK